jgi:hypothetical protein
MSIAIRVDEAIYDSARKIAKAECRTPAQQIAYWAKIGRAALDNPDLPIEFIRDTLASMEDDISLGEPFLPASKDDRN